jgi:chromosome segregation and condensation protein ScpB
LSEAQQTEVIEKNLDKIALIEAALYVTGHPVDLKTLGSVLGIRSEEKIRDAARQLKEHYKNKGAIEVLELSDGRFVMHAGSSASKITSSFFAATTTSSGLTWR